MNRTEALAALTAKGQPYELVETVAMGRPIRAFANAPNSLRELYAETRSDHTFLIYETERLTYEEVWRRACTLARHLVEVQGVRKGDHVAVAMRNYPEWIVAFSATTMCGAVCVAMNALWGPSDMAYALGDAAPKVLLADPERIERLALCTGLSPGLRVIGVRGGIWNGHGGGLALEDILAGELACEAPDVAIEPDDDAIMLYTSGSTGHPKGAVSTHRNILSALLSWEVDAQAAVLTGAAPAPDPNAAPGAALLAIPLFHVSGLHVGLLSSYRAQRALVSMYRWDAETAAQLIERERIASVNAPAAVTGDLVEVARRGGYDLSSLVSVGGGGAPRAPEQVRAISQAFGAARPVTGWGMTETNAIGTSIVAGDYLGRPESSGRVSVVLDIRIVNEDMQEVGTGVRGELQIRGASIMRGYWNRPDANAQTFVDGWLRTGDVAYVDEEGFVFIVDRIKDLVIRGGENVGCGAVEAAILEHPDVIEASVYGVPDDRLGEEVAATVHLRRTLEAQELVAFLSARLARFETPRFIHFSPDPLPRIASGKIDKRTIRQEAIARLASSS